MNQTPQFLIQEKETLNIAEGLASMAGWEAQTGLVAGLRAAAAEVAAEAGEGAAGPAVGLLFGSHSLQKVGAIPWAEWGISVFILVMLCPVRWPVRDQGLICAESME